MTPLQEEAAWLGVANGIIEARLNRRPSSEIESLTRGLRWFKKHDVVQQALDVLAHTQATGRAQGWSEETVVKLCNEMW